MFLHIDVDYFALYEPVTKVWLMSNSQTPRGTVGSPTDPRTAAHRTSDQRPRGGHITSIRTRGLTKDIGDLRPSATSPTDRTGRPLPRDRLQRSLPDAAASGTATSDARANLAQQLMGSWRDMRDMNETLESLHKEVRDA